MRTNERTKIRERLQQQRIEQALRSANQAARENIELREEIVLLRQLEVAIDPQTQLELREQLAALRERKLPVAAPLTERPQ